MNQLTCQLNDKNLNDQVILAPRDFLAFCRAVVERIDGPVFTVDDVKNWLDCLDHKGDVIMELKQLLRDPQKGLAAVTARNKEDK